MTVQDVVATSAFGGLEILDIENGINDRVVYRWNFGKPERVCRAKIRYDGDGLPYFKTKGHKIFIDDVLVAQRFIPLYERGRRV